MKGTNRSVLRIAALAACISSIVLLAGCGEEEQPKQKAAQAAPAEQPLTAKDRVKKAKEQAAAERAAASHATMLPELPPAPEGTEYIELVDAENLIFLYQALTETPDSLHYLADSFETYTGSFAPDDEKLSKLIDAYGNEFDGFKKRDALAALEPALVAEIDKFKAAGRYVKFTQDENVFFGGATYDFEKEGFPVRDLLLIEAPKSEISMQGIKHHAFRITNGQDLAFLPVKDEAVARKIESALRDSNGYVDIQANLYGYVRSVTRLEKAAGQKENRLLDVQIQRLDLVNPDKPGEVYATFNY